MNATDLLLAHFEAIADAPGGVARLRRLILQLAVQGRLVEQDPEDEPASALLERICPTSSKLRLSEWLGSFEQKRPFILPNGWSWTTIEAITVKLGAGSTPLGGKSVYQKDGVKFLRSQNVWNHGLRLDDVAYISQDTHKKMSGTFVRPGDVLLNITGASIGRSAIVPDDFDEGNVSQHVAIVRPATTEIKEFLHLSIISPHVQNLIDQVQVGISREGLSMARLKGFVIPLPPLAEQRRIVARVDALMALCDALEARLREERAAAERLAEALCAAVAAGRPSPPGPRSRARERGDSVEEAVAILELPARREPAPALPLDALPHDNHAPHHPASSLPAPAAAAEGPGVQAIPDGHAAAAALLAERGALTNGELQAALGIDGAAARALLRRLIAEGLARQEGERRGTRYVWAGL